MLRTVREEILEMEMSDREPAYVALYETKKKSVCCYYVAVDKWSTNYRRLLDRKRRKMSNVFAYLKAFLSLIAV